MTPIRQRYNPNPRRGNAIYKALKVQQLKEPHIMLVDKADIVKIQQEEPVNGAPQNRMYSTSSSYHQK